MDRFYLLGYPIRYSLSPEIYKKIFTERGINATYGLLPTKKGELAKRLSELISESAKGFNLTQPLKEEILRFDISLFGVASEIRSVNAVKIESGRLFGFNTDYAGFKKSIMPIKGRIKGKSGTVFGAGGAAKAVVKALLDIGVSELFVANRTLSKAKKLGELFGKRVLPVPLSDAGFAVRKSAIVVNATTVGANGENLLVKEEWIDGEKVLYDLIYARTTPFLKIGKLKKAFVKNGFDMLYFQCVENVNIWYGGKND